MPLRAQRSEHGMTLIEVIVATAIAGILVVIISTVFTNLQKSKKVMDDRAELEDYKLLIRSNLRCKETLAGIASCVPGQLVSLKGAANDPRLSILIPVTGILIQKKYELRARCISTNRKEWDVTWVDVTQPIPSPPKPLFVPPIGCI